MKILLLCNAYNSLAQHVHTDLKACGHIVGIAIATTPEAMTDAVEQFEPELILCPMLTRITPRSIWEKHTCIVLHPGVIGDRGPASLDWAILRQEKEWGVIAVQAAEHVDSGSIWATSEFKMREGSRSSLYRDEVRRAASQAMLVAVERFRGGLFVPAPLDYSAPHVRGRYRPPVKSLLRQIDWASDDVATIVRKIQSADGAPGVLDEINGNAVYLPAPTRRARSSVSRATSSHSETERFVGPRLTVRYGSRISSEKERRQTNTSNYPRRWWWQINLRTCPKSRRHFINRPAARVSARSGTRRTET